MFLPNDNLFGNRFEMFKPKQKLGINHSPHSSVEREMGVRERTVSMCDVCLLLFECLESGRKPKKMTF